MTISLTARVGTAITTKSSLLKSEGRSLISLIVLSTTPDFIASVKVSLLLV
jgi:hypothetical protein